MYWVLKRTISPQIGFQDQLSLNASQMLQGEYSAILLKGSILQYFPSSLSYGLSLRSLFCLFLSGCFTQVILYLIEQLDKNGSFLLMFILAF